jgi:hypothetical protein
MTKKMCSHPGRIGSGVPSGGTTPPGARLAKKIRAPSQAWVSYQKPLELQIPLLLAACSEGHQATMANEDHEQWNKGPRSLSREVVSIDQLSPRLRVDRPTQADCQTLHGSDYIRRPLVDSVSCTCKATNADETMKRRTPSEGLRPLSHGVKVLHYHANSNGFADNQFRKIIERADPVILRSQCPFSKCIGREGEYASCKTTPERCSFMRANWPNAIDTHLALHIRMA